jgi:hypothetical protein
MSSRFLVLFLMRALACFGVLLPIGISYADQSTTRVASRGETLVVATAGKLSVQVKIKTHEIQIGKPSDPRPVLIESSCTYSRYPCSVVDRIDITVNGKPLFVPRSAFCDLADLNDAQIELSKKGSILTLGGGDASETYVAKIEFDATSVKRRTLSSSLEQNRPLQETIYHVVVMGN